MNEQQIEDLLRENKPQVKEDPTFLLETQRRMQAVEGIKAEVDRQRRYGRIAVLCALVFGIVAGSAASLIAYLFPVEAGSLGEGLWESVRLFLDSWKQYLMLPVAACAIALALLLGRTGKAAG